MSKTTIWKFKLEPGGPWSVEMPQGAKLLTAQMQDETPQMWAMVDPDAPKERRCFVVVGTGHPMPVDAWDWTYVGTFQVASWYVFHVFEVPAA